MDVEIDLVNTLYDVTVVTTKSGVYLVDTRLTPALETSKGLLVTV